MSERIDQFCENLRVKLTSIDDNMRALKAKIDSKQRTVEQDVQISPGERQEAHCARSCENSARSRASRHQELGRTAQGG